MSILLYVQIVLCLIDKTWTILEQCPLSHTYSVFLAEIRDSAVKCLFKTQKYRH